MTPEEIQAYVERELPQIAYHLGLDDWTIRLAFEAISEDEEHVLADCTVSPEYGKAEITFFTGALAEETEEQLRDTIIHELLHILQSDWFAFGEMVDTALEDSKPVLKLIDHAWSVASELQVRAIINMLKSVGVNL